MSQRRGRVQAWVMGSLAVIALVGCKAEPDRSEAKKAAEPAVVSPEKPGVTAEGAESEKAPADKSAADKRAAGESAAGESAAGPEKPALPEVAVVTVASAPSDASVKLEGAELGRTPYELKVKGEIAIEVAREGFLPKKLVVRADGPPNVAVTLDPDPAAKPDVPPLPPVTTVVAGGAPPVVEKIEAAATEDPVRAPAPDVQAAPPEPSAPGLEEPAEPAPAEPAPNEPAPPAVPERPLVPGEPPGDAAPVEVTVASNPSGAEVTLGGVKLGVTPLELTVKEPKTITISAKGYEHKAVTLSPTGETVVAVTLEKRKAPPAAAPKPTFRNFRQVKDAYRAGKITKVQYKALMDQMKERREREILRAKHLYESGKISKDEYKRRRTAIDARYD